MYFSKLFNTVKQGNFKKEFLGSREKRFPTSGAKLEIVLHMPAAMRAMLVWLFMASKSDVQRVGLFLAVDNVQ